MKMLVSVDDDRTNISPLILLYLYLTYVQFYKKYTGFFNLFLPISVIKDTYILDLFRYNIICPYHINIDIIIIL